ncbi:NUDIX hydrolase [Dermatobacter hominis]|uniref:NUDIX hydrolase n=1 Tax=Dermatobacter hominis TaxID=2884263 RepID=UPI001D0FF89B|nr:hypothetical protein [Dermatobacter hominis]UDY34395.1 hypothetical protein LH044_13745 [Dermatobacter hominis]
MSTVPMGAVRPEDVPVRDASTVMLVRDGDRGLEVCLMQRNLASDFVGGAYVFPGGAVDPEDSDPASAAVCAGLDDAEASRRLGIEAGGLAFWVAAIRESFEEAGVLIARHADGRPLDVTDPSVAERFVRHRQDVDHCRRTIAAVAVEEDLRLDAGALHYFSRWITPLGSHRRYDTRFFVAAAPDQEVVHDDRELIGTEWLTPVEALRRHDDGEIVMIFPTVRTLVALSRFDGAAAVLDHARALSEVRPVLPTVTEGPDGMRIRLPGDPELTGGVYDAGTGRPLADGHD